MASGVDTLTTGPRAAASPSAPKRNALPLEVAVDVTGARPGVDPSQRELFAESTTSVLAFENGGVLRLAADVEVGQLLFLTLVATKREVVAQVARKHPLGTGFVEVEFTEPSPGFWGIDIPSGAEPPQVDPAPPNAPPQSASAEPAEPREPDKKEFAAQDLLPKAALDFSHADAAAALAPQKKEPARKPRAAGNLRWVVLGAAIPATIVGALWYGGFIPGFGRAGAQPAKSLAVAQHSATVKPASASAAPQKPALAPGSHSASAQANLAPAGFANDSPAPNGGDSPSASPVAPVAIDAAEPASSEGLSKSANPAASRREKVDSSSKAEKSEENSSTVRPAAVKVPSDDAGDVVPPKLLQSIRAVAPPDAIRSFATGNVVLDALVDSTGHIQSSKVLSGPAVLHDAAISALKQYKYAPATQRGKPVEAHVQVTVQFWYEP